MMLVKPGIATTASFVARRNQNPDICMGILATEDVKLMKLHNIFIIKTEIGAEI